MCQLASTSDDFASIVICVELAQEAKPWPLGVVAIRHVHGRSWFHELHGADHARGRDHRRADAGAHYTWELHIYEIEPLQAAFPSLRRMCAMVMTIKRQSSYDQRARFT